MKNKAALNQHLKNLKTLKRPEDPHMWGVRSLYTQEIDSIYDTYQDALVWADTYNAQCGETRYAVVKLPGLF